MKKSCTLAAVAATGLLTMVGMAGKASAQCTTYNVTTTAGGVIDPGTVRVDGTGADDTTFAVPGGMPFAWNFYGTTYPVGATVGACSNGFLLLGSTAVSSFSNACLPSATMGANASIMPFWDDQITTDLAPATGRGIFTSVTGSAPNRVFNVEWRNRQYNNSNVLNYEVRIYEGQTYFDFIYGTMSVASSATVGVEKTSTPAVFTSVSCNSTSIIPSGTVYRFDCPVSQPPSLALTTSTANGTVGATFAAFANVTPGTGPSSPITSVSLNATTVNGGTVALHNDGVAPDVTAGDSIWSGNVTVGAGATDGDKTLTTTATDALARTGSGNATFHVGYCAASATTSDEFISGVQVAGINHTTGAWPAGGYQDLRGVSANVNPGASYPMTINCGPPNYAGDQGTAWVDWNNNGAFEASEQIGAMAGSPGNGPYTGTLNVPAGQPFGSYAMRVRINYAAAPPACGNTTYGSTEDYTLNVTAATYPIINANSVSTYPGGTVLVSAAVTPVSGHPITSVTAQMNSINGSALTIPLYDDGTHGDASAGDGTYSNTYTVSGATTMGGYSIPMTATDNQPLSATSNGSIAVRAQNDECTGALPAVVGDNAFDSTNTVGVTTSTPAATCGALGADLWFSFSDPAGGDATLTTFGGSTSDTAMAVYTDCNTTLACNDDSCGLQSRVVFCAAPGQTYLFRIGGYNAARWAGTFNLAVVHTPPTTYSNPSPNTPEGEACGVNNPDTVDGGCNSTPNVYIQMSTCTNYVGSVASSTSFRDTDWYQFTTAGDTFNLTGQAQFPAYVFVIGEPCPGTVAAGPFSNAVGGGCNPNYNFSASVTLAPGTYDIVVVPQNFDGLTVCGSNEQYWFNLSPAAGCTPDVCCRNDYNGDGDIGTDADIEAFFACLGGNCCATCPTDADFNCDGDIGTDADIESFFRVLAGGPC